MSPNTCMMSPALKVSSAWAQPEKPRQMMSKNCNYTSSTIHILCMCKSDLYVCVGGALPWIIIKDGDHSSSSWGWVCHRCDGGGGGGGSGSLAGIWQPNRKGQTLLTDILIITGGTRLCYSIQLISMQLIVHVRLTQHHAKLRRSCITAVKHVKIKVKTKVKTTRD